MKAALYARVSSDKQTTANQLGELHQLVAARGWEPVLYEETESAAKKRPVFERLLVDARAGRVGAIVVWKLDRLHRSLRGSVNDVLDLEAVGVQVVSVRDTWMDTRGPVRPLLLAIFGWVAETERTTLIERTKAGQARARAEGKRIGRPPVSSVLLLGACERVERGTHSVREACKEMSVKETTLRRTLRARQAKNGGGGGPPTPPSARSAA